MPSTGHDSESTGKGALYGALFNLMPSSVVLLELDGRVRDVNPAFCRHMGFTREELIGTHVSRFSKDDPEVIRQNLSRMRAGETLEHEVINRQRDGAFRHYEIRERAVDLPDGTRGILVVAEDITDRKVAEAERLELERGLLRAQKLESLAVLAGGIAHDYNNLLTVILGGLETATALIPATSPAQDDLRSIARAAKRAAELTRQMLAYSGHGRFVDRPVRLATLVADTLKAIQPQLPPSATITQEHASLPEFHGDAAQVVQAIKGLLANAVEALPPEGGRIHIRTAVAQVDHGGLPGNCTDQPLLPGPYVVLEVSDTGAGMTDAVRQRMFEPFFTTKFSGRGLGLAAVLGIVRGHQSGIAVESTPGRGTTVRILFPAAAAPVEPAPVAPSAPLTAAAAAGFRGTVLLAEDDEGVRTLLRGMLCRMGLDVVAVATGEEALAQFRQAEAAIDFALLDYTMPGMSGVETLARLREIRPNLCAVLTSGFPRDAIKGLQAEAGFVGFIQKPFDNATFRRIVGEVCSTLALPRRADPRGH